MFIGRSPQEIEDLGRSITEQSDTPVTDVAKGVEVFAPDGTPTSQYDMLRAGEVAEQSGTIAPRDDGFLKEFGQSFKAGAARGVAGLQKTLTQAGYMERDSLDATNYWLANRPELGQPKNLGLKDKGWWGHIAGSATADSLPAIATGATIAATGGGALAVGAGVFGATFLRTFGDIGEQIEQDLGDSVDPMEKYGAQMMESIVSSLIEVGLGVEAPLAQAFGKAALIKTLKRAGGRKLLTELGMRSLGKSAFRVGRGVGGFALQAGGEGVEGDLQRLTHDVGMDVLGDKRFSEFNEYVSDFVNGTVGGMFLSGGMGMMSYANQKTLRNMGDPIDDKKRMQVHTRWVDGQALFDGAGQARADAAFNRLRATYEQRFAPDTAAALASVQRTIAYNIALSKKIAPETTLAKLAFIEEELTDNDVNVLEGLASDQDKTVAYLNRRFDLNNRVHDMLTEVDAGTMSIRTDQLERQSPPLDDIETERLNERVNLALERVGLSPEATPVAEEAPIPAPRIVTPAEAAAEGVVARLGEVSEAGVPILDEEYLASLENSQSIQRAQEQAQDTIESAQGARARLQAVKDARDAIGDAVERITEGPLTDAKIEQSLQVADELIKRIEQRQGAPVEKREAFSIQIIDNGAQDMDVADREALYIEGVERPDGSIVRVDRKGNIVVTPPLMGDMIGQGRAAAAVEDPAQAPTTTEGGVRGDLAVQPEGVVAAKDFDISKAVEQKRVLDFQNRQQRRQESLYAIRGQQPSAAAPRTGGGVVLAQREGEAPAPRGIKGQYFSDYNLAVFYSKADAGTVMHEWWHHLMMQDLIPAGTMRRLMSAFNDDKEMWTEVGYENSANAFLAYVRDGVLPQDADPALVKDFQHIKSIYARAYGQMKALVQSEGQIAEGTESIGLTPESEAAFAPLLGVVPDGLASLQGDSLATAMSVGYNGDARNPALMQVDNDDAFYDFDDRRTELAEARVQQFMTREEGKQASWPYLPFARIKKIWNDRAKQGFVRDEAGMQRITDNAIDIIALMSFETVVGGHTQLSPEEEFERMGRDLTEEEIGEYLEWTGLHLSDYAMAPLERLGIQMMEATTADEQLILVDRMLNTIHMASDLQAENFIEGGAYSLNELAGTGEFGDAYKPALFQRELPADIPDATAMRNWMYKNRWVSPEGLKNYARSLGHKGSDPQRDLSMDELKRVPRLVPTRPEIRRDLLAQFGVESESQLKGEAYERFMVALEWLTVDHAKNTPPKLPPVDEAARDDLLNAMRDIPDDESLRARAGGGPMRLQNLKNGLRKVGRAGRRMFTDMGNVIYHLNGNSTEGVWTDKFWKPIKKLRADTEALQNEDDSEYIALGKKYDIDLTLLDYMEDDVFIGGVAFKMQDALRIHRMARSETRKAALLLSNRDVTPQVIKDADALVAKDKRLSKMSKILDDIYERKWGQAAVVFERLTGKKLGKVLGYEPMKRLDATYADHDELNALMAEQIGVRGITPRKSRMPSELKSAKQVKGSEIVLGSATHALRTYQEAINTYVAKTEGVVALSKLLDDEQVKDMMGDKYGSDMGTWRTLDWLIRGELFPGGRMEAMTEWERWAQNMRLQFTTALLGGRLLTMPKQILSLPAELGAVPGNQAVNLTRALKYMGEFKNVLWRKVQKGAADKNLLEGTKTADLISKHAPWIWRRHGGEPEVAELDVRGFSGLAKKIRVNGRPLGEVALMGLKRFDLMTVATGFQVAYDAVYEIEMNKSGDPTKADVRAGEFAGDMIRDFHPPSLTVERNYAQRGSELIKGAMPFSGQTQKNLQMFQYRVLMPLAQAYKKGGAPSVMRALVEKKGDLDTSIAQRAVYMAAVPALVMGFLARRRPPDEVEAMQDLILYPLSSVPIIGPAILFGSMYGDREPAMTPSYLSFAATTISVLHDVASKEIDLSGKTGRDSLRAIAMWTGLPDALLQIARIASKKMVVEGMSLEDITAEDYLEIMGARIKEPRE